jgi:hypothetical protein
MQCKNRKGDNVEGDRNQAVGGSSQKKKKRRIQVHKGVNFRK